MSDGFQPDFGAIGVKAPPWSAKRPMRIAILGDFGGGAGRGRLDDGDALAKRKPLKVEFDTLEDTMRRLDLELSLPIGADGAPIAIELGDLDAFHPDSIYREVPLFAELSSLRKRLNQPAQFAAASKEVLAWAEGAGPRASSLARRAQARGTAPARGATLDDFARLTGRASTAKSGDAAVDRLLERVVGPFVVAAASPNKDALVAAVDAGLGDAMRAVLHHPDFQTAESLWRGVDFVLRKLETSHQLQVHLFDVSAEEFAADLSAAADLAETGLYRLLVEAPSQDADGGYALIAACYQFDATPPHAELLGRAAQVAAHAGAPLLTGIATDPFGDRKEPPHRLVADAFAALRALPAARFLGLLGPRFLLRHPYGKKSDPISAFAFEEFSREAGLRGMLWGHPALLALAVLARRGAPLVVDDLPFHHYVDADGDSIALPCTDRLISTNLAALLRTFGINSVLAHKGEALVRFNGLESVDGQPLPTGGAAPKPVTGEPRVAVQAKVGARDGKVKVRFEESAKPAKPPKRREPEPESEPADDDEGPVAAADDDEALADASSAEATSDDGAAAEPEASDGSDDAAAATEAAPESAGDDELSALLASLDDPKPADGETAEAEEEIDPDLDALLKSLG